MCEAAARTELRMFIEKLTGRSNRGEVLFRHVPTRVDRVPLGIVAPGPR
jgi:hypothetical protein